jgi:hypothetical protein
VEEHRVVAWSDGAVHYAISFQLDCNGLNE